jgi:hypothetical protein
MASQSLPMTGANALVSLIRFFIASISPKARSRSRRVFFLRKAGFHFSDLSRQCLDFGCKCVAPSARAIKFAAEILKVVLSKHLFLHVDSA